MHGGQGIAQPLVKCPVEIGMFPHWLAIEGRQPAIPENAPIERRRPAARRTRPAANAEAAGELSSTIAAVPISCSSTQQPLLRIARVIP